GYCRFGDACKYLHNGVHGKSTLLPRTSGSASSVPDVTRLDLDMLQSLLANFGLNAPNTFTPSPPVAYTVSIPPGFPSVSAQLFAQPTCVGPQLLPGSFGGVQYGNGWVIPTGVQYPTRSLQHGVYYPHQGVQTLSSPSQGVHFIPGPSQPPVQFTIGVQHQQGGSFPGSVHLGQSPSMPFYPSQLFASGSQGSGQATLFPNAFNTTTLQDPASDNWNMDTSARTHLNDFIHCLSDILNMCIYPFVAVGDGHFIPFVRDNSCTVEFDPFGFSVKDFITRRVLLRCDSTGDFYPVTKPSTIPHAFLSNTNHKLIPRAAAHAANHFGYRCLDFNTSKIIISRHVTINETVFPFPSTKSITTPSYDFSDDSTDLISTIIRNAPITPVPAPVHTPQVDVPTPPTLPTPPTPLPPPTPQSVPQIVPKHALVPTNDSPTVSIHPMVTRSRIGTTRPNPRYAGHVSTISPLPRSYKEATSVPRPEGATIVHCMWLFRHKFLADGTLSQYKARLVVNGSTQLDVKNAFLHGDLAETVYMHQPPGFQDHEHPNYVCLLQRSLYGLKQAPRAWFQRFAAYITTVGFTPSRCDSSLFIYKQGDDTSFFLLYVDDIVLTASYDRLL
nr:ribonuclease H-like domain-containing protein [Tanacetum cinerariifolium]